MSSITLAQMHFGVLVAKSGPVRAERLRRLQFVERVFDSQPIDDAVAESYGLIAAAVVDTGRQPRARSTDLLIAATAHAHDTGSSPANPADFGGLDDLVEVVSI